MASDQNHEIKQRNLRFQSNTLRTSLSTSASSRCKVFRLC